ncbi:initiator tRNA phosphoribosyl transferase [Athelia psychrophila]|uniref:Initiator tRNA phosphoribosyl transferase n=1 Tax=Athelia psychrophila TaxID=1759441 RepID=A0A166CK10_9AGAM|nr:initiator tRNA phosphoribosyl transferase [Fibularhizoctonia sp. CBS 109695]
MDFILIDRDTASSTRDALAHIRLETLDIYNRLHSIAEDVLLVNFIHENYPDLPILPNLRCGAWYTDPHIAEGSPAYFKSTDGHFGSWGFNLRRPNLHLLSLLASHPGFILVDSTRAGKRIPDALSKTVPIWCAVINRAILKIYPELASDKWDTMLYTPPQVVSPQEHAQIEKRLDEWANALANSSYDIPRLNHPLRPLWITPANSRLPTLPTNNSEARMFSPVICLSASKQVHDGLERRGAGYTYVQGSGDDHEMWGKGLTPKLFWDHQDELLGAPHSKLDALVEKIVTASSDIQAPITWVTLPTPIEKVAGRLCICANADLPDPWPSYLPGSDDSERAAAYIQISPSPEATTTSHLHADHDSKHLIIDAAEGKRGQYQYLQTVLPLALPFMETHLRAGSRICISCETGKDMSVGVALAALQSFWDGDGVCILDTAVSAPSKESIKTRLQWIIASRPQANPSRATLKRTNEFLLTPAAFGRPIPIGERRQPSEIYASAVTSIYA